MIELKTGDNFCVASGTWVNKGINFFQRLWAKDKQARYGHAGYIKHPEGETLENQDGKIQNLNFFERYAGQQVIIVRPKYGKDVDLEAIIKEVEDEYLGNMYPYWRILFHTNPLTRRISWGKKFLVCSELLALILRKAGMRAKSSIGVNPDKLVDQWRAEPDNYEIVFEGILPASN